jgi:hypothetical protein
MTLGHASVARENGRERHDAALAEVDCDNLHEAGTTEVKRLDWPLTKFNYSPELGNQDSAWLVKTFCSSSLVIGTNIRRWA